MAQMAETIRLADDSQRTIVIGRTGTGKTVAGAYHLSQRNFNHIPWVIVNFKRDEFLDSIPHVKNLDKFEIPKKKGLYQIHPDIEDFSKKGGPGDNWLIDIWRHGKVGLFFDEVMVINRDLKGVKAIQTQGRSLLIPTIACSQRPVAIAREFFSEADFFQIFPLNDARDYKTIDGFVPHRLVNTEFPNRYSYYHDVGLGKAGAMVIPPVPAPEETLELFDEKLRKFRRVKQI
jgi:hypothetical protein